MKIDKTNSIRDKMIAKVLKTPIGKEIELKNCWTKTVRFDFWGNSADSIIRKTPYTWRGKLTKEYYHRSIFPMKNTNYVKFFKTLKGAKRNFIKNYLKIND